MTPIKDYDQFINCIKRVEARGLIQNVRISSANFRDVSFQTTMTNTDIKMEWWVNIAYLILDGDIKIPFDKFEASGTWPNHYKTNLQCENRGNVCCIIPLEEYNQQ